MLWNGIGSTFELVTDWPKSWPDFRSLAFCIYGGRRRETALQPPLASKSEQRHILHNVLASRAEHHQAPLLLRASATILFCNLCTACWWRFLLCSVSSQRQEILNFSCDKTASLLFGLSRMPVSGKRTCLSTGMEVRWCRCRSFHSEWNCPPADCAYNFFYYLCRRLVDTRQQHTLCWDGREKQPLTTLTTVVATQHRSCCWLWSFPRSHFWLLLKDIAKC